VMADGTFSRASTTTAQFNMEVTRLSRIKFHVTQTHAEQPSRVILVGRWGCLKFVKQTPLPRGDKDTHACPSMADVSGVADRLLVSPFWGLHAMTNGYASEPIRVRQGVADDSRGSPVRMARRNVVQNGCGLTAEI
jgi:hypothetical protein